MKLGPVITGQNKKIDDDDIPAIVKSLSFFKFMANLEQSRARFWMDIFINSNLSSYKN